MLHLLLFVSLASAASLYYNTITATTEISPEPFVIYSGSHDIVEIAVPLDDIDNRRVLMSGPGLPDVDYKFFVEADLRPDGTKGYKGVYVFKQGEAKKILGNGPLELTNAL